MATYRTIPEKVEAIQYTGVQATPFAGTAPSWVWTGISSDVLKFTAHGIEINYNGMSEDVLPGDWLVMHNDGIIRVCGDTTFKKFYTRSRKLSGEADATQEAAE